MTKTTHTHRGTCQACGHVQASANANALIAKHGYTVDWGYFNGTCQGSDKAPAEHDVTLTRNVIAFCTETAADHDEEIADLKSGKTVPSTFARYNPNKVVEHKTRRGDTYTTKGGDDMLPIAQARPDERTKAIALAIHEHEMHASGLRSHADILTKFVLVRLGQPLYLAADLDAPKPKAVAPVVDVANAKVVGEFKTKAARKDALDKLNRQFEKLRERVSDAYLAGDRGERGRTLYYAAHGLSQWRPHHSAAVLELYPALASTVAEIEALVAAREAVKAAP